MELFAKSGAHVVVDGQFGSTGKGVLAAWLARQAHETKTQFSAVLSNAGPNSGHTFYDDKGEKHVLKQLPTFAVAMYVNYGVKLPVFLTGGAVIDPAILADEAKRYPLPILVHASAAFITLADKAAEADRSGTVAAAAGTRSGTGAAIARKVLRDPSAVFVHHFSPDLGWPDNVMGYHELAPHFYLGPRLFVEVSQGFSLGPNQGFYPKCTSRECTVAQAMADASLPPQMVSKVYMSMRTYPIRVGNVDGFSSGDWYDDQEEVSWDDIGVEPELTTVTKRPRRIATFSWKQLVQALLVNNPDYVFMNFMNYLDDESPFMHELVRTVKAWATKDIAIIPCDGPKSEDVRW